MRNEDDFPPWTLPRYSTTNYKLLLPRRPTPIRVFGETWHIYTPREPYLLVTIYYIFLLICVMTTICAGRTLNYVDYPRLMYELGP